MLLISAGVGATPVLAMLQALAQARSEREIWWLHSARNGREHSFAAESRDLLAVAPERAQPRLLHPARARTTSRARDSTPRGVSAGSVLAALEPPVDAQAYLCGPVPFMDEISAGLSSLGVEAADIHTEPFGPAPARRRGSRRRPRATLTRRPGEAGGGPTIEFARSDLAIPWSDDYGSLLELAEACDVPVRWSCRTGCLPDLRDDDHRRGRGLQP